MGGLLFMITITKARVIKTVLIVVFMSYIGFILYLFLSQRDLLYRPSTTKLSEESLTVKSLRYWPSDENYRGVTHIKEVDDAKGTAIVFHGNGGAAHHRRFYIDALTLQGFRVILAEYPGYGGRDGQPSETTVVDDALETLNLAYEMYGEPLFLWGESLGSGVVSSIASQTTLPLKGLALLVPWDSLSNLVQSHYWYLPTDWMILDQYNSVKNLRQFKGNIAVMLAEQDEVIPIKLGTRLFESIETNKRLWLFEGAKHSTVPTAADLSWWKEVSGFISQ